MSVQVFAPATPAAPDTADDLQRIHGIGSAIEARLHAGGIRTFAQLADLSAHDLAVLLRGYAGLSVERIRKQGWIEQARELADAARPDSSDERARSSQRYATFTIQLLLDDESNVRRTRVAYIQGGAEESWPSWDMPLLAGFVERHAGLNLSPPKPIATSGALAESTLTINKTVRVFDAPHLGSLQLVSRETGKPCHLLPQGQEFDAHLTIDFRGVQHSDDVPFCYAAVVAAKKLGEGAPTIVGQSNGSIVPSDEVTIAVPVAGLSQGDYQLGAGLWMLPTVIEGGAPLDITIEKFLEHQNDGRVESCLLHIY